jgi:hypothetical protein
VPSVAVLAWVDADRLFAWLSGGKDCFQGTQGHVQGEVRVF